MPSAAKAAAMAAPRPEPAPVTTAVPPVELAHLPLHRSAVKSRGPPSTTSPRMPRSTPEPVGDRRARRRCPCACSARRRRPDASTEPMNGDETHHVARAARLLDDAARTSWCRRRARWRCAPPAATSWMLAANSALFTSLTTSALPRSPTTKIGSAYAATTSRDALDVVRPRRPASR